MKLIDSSFEILEQKPGLNGLYELITMAGYTCYKTEKEITSASAKNFINKLIQSGHGAMLEHGTVYMKMTWNSKDMNTEEQVAAIKYMKNPYSKVNFYHEEPLTSCSEDRELMNGYVTTNYRVLVENKWLKDLKYAVDPTVYHEPRFTVRFICDRGVSHELVRHRVFSFAQESTRYCNYSSDKFGNELTFIQPSWWDSASDVVKSYFNKLLKQTEMTYLNLLDYDCTPQQARQVLPNAIKTEIVMTGFKSDWNHFFDLRAIGTTGKPHPDMEKLAKPLLVEFVHRGYMPDNKLQELWQNK